MPIKIDEIINSASIIGRYADYDKNAAIPYLGLALWPAKTRETIDLKFLKVTRKQIPALAASTIDSETLIRGREGLEMDEKEMAYFSESMEIGNKDRLELQKLDNVNSPFVKDVVRGIYDDLGRLKAAADIVPEQMRMQLLFPKTGGPSITVGGKDNTFYKYDYDVDGKWAANNRVDLSGVKLWTNTDTATPLDDIEDLLEKADIKLTRMFLHKKTFSMMKKCKQIQDIFINKVSSGTVRVTDAMVKQYLLDEYGIKVYIYDRKDRDEMGNEFQYAPTGYIAFSGDSIMGNTWYGITPDELARMENTLADISIGANKLAVKKYTDPFNNLTTITVSEMLLPSYENMYNVYLMFVGSPETTGTQLKLLTAASEEGTTSGTTKFNVTDMVDSTNNTLRIKAFAEGEQPEIPNYLDYLGNWTGSKAYTSGEDFTVANGTTCVIAEVNKQNRCVSFVTVVSVTKA